MQIKPPGSQPSARGPSDWFTGTVRIDPLHEAPEPARSSAATVTFEPGAPRVPCLRTRKRAAPDAPGLRCNHSSNIGCGSTTVPLASKIT